MNTEERADFIQPEEIEKLLAKRAAPSSSKVRELLAKARELQGLTMEDVAAMMHVQDTDLLAEIYSTAKTIKEEIYGSRLVFFAPLYISNRCANECTYCAFRATNAALTRRTLTQEEVKKRGYLFSRDTREYCWWRARRCRRKDFNTSPTRLRRFMKPASVRERSAASM